jgi:DNA polymerase IIIc chi subunit
MSRSCQVDFYVLARPDQSAQHLACKLALMAWEQGHRVMVLTVGETDSAIPEPGRFSRLLEIVPADDRQRTASRLKFREYRDLGLNPESHTIGH